MATTVPSEAALLSARGIDGSVLDIVATSVKYSEPSWLERRRQVDFTYRVTAANSDGTGWGADGLVPVAVGDLTYSLGFARRALSLDSVTEPLVLLRLPDTDPDLEVRLSRVDGATATIVVWQHRGQDGPIDLSFEVTLGVLESVTAQLEAAISELMEIPQ